MPDEKTSFQVEAKVDIADFDDITRKAVKKLGDELQVKEREDVAAGGMARFARRTRVFVRSGGQHGWVIDVVARPNWMRVHEYGAISVAASRGGKAVRPGKGKAWTVDYQPMLWVPLFTPRMRAATFVKTRYKLFKPPGKNVLISPLTGKVLYYGIPRMENRPILHMREIAEEEAEKFVENVQDYANA
jgi:hypothetical protein